MYCDLMNWVWKWFFAETFLTELCLIGRKFNAKDMIGWLNQECHLRNSLAFLAKISWMYIKFLRKKLSNLSFFFHTAQCGRHNVTSVEKQEIISHRKNISWNQLSSNFVSKNVGFTKFLSKKSEREHSVEKWHIYSLSPKNISSNHLCSNLHI